MGNTQCCTNYSNDNVQHHQGISRKVKKQLTSNPSFNLNTYSRYPEESKLCLPSPDFACRSQHTSCNNVMGVDLIAEEESVKRTRDSRVPRSSYYDNFNSSIFGEQVRTLSEERIPLQLLNQYERKFDQDMNKNKLVMILQDLQRSVAKGSKQWIQKVNEDGYVVMISQTGSRLCSHQQNPMAPLVYSKMTFDGQDSIERVMQAIYSPIYRFQWDDVAIVSSNVLRNMEDLLINESVCVAPAIPMAQSYQQKFRQFIEKHVLFQIGSKYVVYKSSIPPDHRKLKNIPKAQTIFHFAVFSQEDDCITFEQFSQVDLNLTGTQDFSQEFHIEQSSINESIEIKFEKQNILAKLILATLLNQAPQAYLEWKQKLDLYLLKN